MIDPSPHLTLDSRNETEQYCSPAILFSSRTDSIYRCKGFDRSDSSFFFSALIQASIGSRMPLSVQSSRSFSSRSISSLIFAISWGENMAQVYDAEQS